MTKHYSATEDELTQIKNDCYYPNALSCDGCHFVDVTIGCNWKGANILQDEIMERPDPFEVLKAWVRETSDNLDHGYYDATVYVSLLHEMINRLREEPEEVVKEGIKEGWWKV